MFRLMAQEVLTSIKCYLNELKMGGPFTNLRRCKSVWSISLIEFAFISIKKPKMKLVKSSLIRPAISCKLYRQTFSKP